MERKGNMRDRFDIDQVIKITGLGIRAEQADGGADFDVACQNAVKKLWKIKEYESLEEQNRLLKLPCAVGDTVYVLRLYNTAYMMNNEKVWEIVEDKFEIFYFDSIGKTVFLTREEAEAALKELERGKGE
nr:hypothetical protein [uncultured Schaedlerella sp.]